ncbi:MAG: hypothetical protein R2735_11365 [Microthrixaceae bacterium]
MTSVIEERTVVRALIVAGGGGREHRWRAPGGDINGDADFRGFEL